MKATRRSFLAALACLPFAKRVPSLILNGKAVPFYSELSPVPDTIWMSAVQEKMYRQVMMDFCVPAPIMGSAEPIGVSSANAIAYLQRRG